MTVFDPDGEMAGSVVLPDGLEIEEIGTSYILGRYTDDLGVEYIRMHELRSIPVKANKRAGSTARRAGGAEAITAPESYTYPDSMLQITSQWPGS